MLFVIPFTEVFFTLFILGSRFKKYRIIIEPCNLSRSFHIFEQFIFVDHMNYVLFLIKRIQIVLSYIIFETHQMIIMPRNFACFHAYLLLSIYSIMYRLVLISYL